MIPVVMILLNKIYRSDEKLCQFDKGFISHIMLQINKGPKQSYPSVYTYKLWVLKDRIVFNRRLVRDRPATGQQLVQSNQQPSATDPRLVGNWMETVLSSFFKIKVLRKNKTMFVQVAIMIKHLIKLFCLQHNRMLQLRL